MTVKEQFLKDIKEGIANKEVLLSVDIQIPDMSRSETVMNQQANFQAKYDYFEEAYDDHLHLKSNPAISIVSYMIGIKMVNVIEVMDE
ncbi:hypothetical protein [Lactococcus petauri]|uniref:hypothetical protein n=1 Tax=Lactococcus petauri TaxID=1940789 RepID=UPI0038549912